jgi:hypothetical protein
MRRKGYFSDVSARLLHEPELFDTVVTCDETWIFQYDSETNKMGESRVSETGNSANIKMKSKILLICVFCNSMNQSPS